MPNKSQEQPRRLPDLLKRLTASEGVALDLMLELVVHAFVLNALRHRRDHHLLLSHFLLDLVACAQRLTASEGSSHHPVETQATCTSASA